VRGRRRINLGKAAVFAIIINTLQILLVFFFLLYVYIQHWNDLSGAVQLLIPGCMGLVTCWGAVVDIQEALAARHVEQQALMLEEANEHMDELNRTLRAQRHDFMNHLQVVYSLLEMDEKEEAADYLEDVYKDLQRVSRILKSGVPAVNALLAAKLADCEERGIVFEMHIDSPWDHFAMDSWEICRVLGNLIDNAMDALEGSPSPAIRLTLGETLRDYTFSVANNGPQIPEEMQESIFVSGFSTKSTGRGMGLAIVREILESHCGILKLESSAEITRFSGRLPKAAEESIQNKGKEM